MGNCFNKKKKKNINEEKLLKSSENKEILKNEENINKIDFGYIPNGNNLYKDIEKDKNNFSEEINQKIHFKNKEKTKIINIPNIYKLDYFTIRDIEEENKKLRKEIIQKAISQMKDGEKNKNESIAIFLIDIAYISRKSFIKSKKLLDLVNRDYGNDIKKNFNYEDENDREKLSSYLKKNEGIKDLYTKYFSNENFKFKSSNEQKYLEELFFKLTILYFHCRLIFPSIKINFKINDNEFSQETMRDFLNLGKGKVNFAYLPSLYYNENILKNGELQVYTYDENEFYFDEKSLKYLNEIS